jgi:polyhydroxyalkanoic acid synthase PhaR subunit
MTTPSGNEPSNPFELWKQIYDANERAWSTALENAMSSPNFAEAQGRFLETITAAQKSLRDNTRNFLQTMNVPTREDISRLGELITQLEEKVDRLDDRLMSIEQLLQNSTPTPSKSRSSTSRRR